MDMNIDVAYLFRGGQPADSYSDTPTSERQKSSRGTARADAGRDHAGTKGSKHSNNSSDQGNVGYGTCPPSSSEPYVAAYSATGRQSLRLSTASYSTTGELEMVSFGELPNKDIRRMRSQCEDQAKPPNPCELKSTEAYCVSGPPSTAHTTLVTLPSSTAPTDRGQEDTPQVAELQQKLEVSCEWAYELERDVADLSLEVEGLRDVCAQLQHSLDHKDQQLADAHASNGKLCKRLASAEALLAEHFGITERAYRSPLPPSSGRSAPEVYQTAPAYQHMMQSTSSPALQSIHQVIAPPLSSESRPSTPAEVAAGPYPTLTPLRTSLSSPSMNAAVPDRKQAGRSARDGLRPSAAYHAACARSSSSGGSVQRASLYPSVRQ